MPRTSACGHLRQGRTVAGRCRLEGQVHLLRRAGRSGARRSGRPGRPDHGNADGQVHRGTVLEKTGLLGMIGKSERGPAAIEAIRAQGGLPDGEWAVRPIWSPRRFEKHGWWPLPTWGWRPSTNLWWKTCRSQWRSTCWASPCMIRRRKSGRRRSVKFRLRRDQAEYDKNPPMLGGFLFVDECILGVGLAIVMRGGAVGRTPIRCVLA
jgi:hypothetical protein